MEISGCRFSEVQSISYQRITKDGRVIISGKKGSQDRLISDKRVESLLLKSKAMEFNPFTMCHINSANRHLIRLNLYLSKEGRKKMTLSGIFRESYANQIRSVENLDSTVSQFLGHKNNTNGRFYGKS
jgi:integrase